MTLEALLWHYDLCRVDISSSYGKKIAQVFHATQFPQTTIIDRTGSVIIYQRVGHLTTEDWVTALISHKRGDRRQPLPSSLLLSGDVCFS